MTDAPNPAPLDVRAAKPSLLQRVSLVWLVPILALAISLYVAWESYSSQGVEITISFENASGIAADETEIRYRDVSVGRVEKVDFAEGLGDVLVRARVDQEIAPYLDQDARFWVVRPDVSVRGISGLDTVLSGVYIEGSWNTEPDVQQYEFTGLEEPPLTRAGQRGTEIVLRTTDGSALTTGAPILHKGIQVGYLETPRLSADGRSVTVSAFIESPYDRRITTNTRFWDTSGFSVSFGSAGLNLDVNSIASLIEGGIAYDTVVSGGQPIRDGQIFDLFDSPEAAENSLFNDPDLPRLDVAVLFDGSVNGLSVGSEVRFQGIRVGEVTALDAVAVESEDGPLVQLRAVLSIEPGRLGLGGEATPDDALGFLADFVRQQNLRARLVTGNILTGSLNVQLLPVPEDTANFIDLGAEPFPIIPTTTNAITDVADQADNAIARINELKIEELIDGAINLMDSIERVARNEALTEGPDEIQALIADMRALVGSEDIQSIPAQLGDIMDQVGGIVSDVDDAELVTSLQTAIDNANSALANLDTASANLPALTEELQALTAKANALELETLLATASETLNGINGITGQESTQALPETLNSLLTDAGALFADEELQALPTELQDIVANLNATITEIREAGTITALNEAIASANTAAQNLDSATDGLPAITAEVERLAAQAADLELDALVAEATSTLDNINALIASDATQDLPSSLSAALDEVSLFLADIRDGGAVQNVNAALASANEAAQAIEEAAASLPALSARAGRLVAETEGVLQSYGDRSRFNAETLSTLRDIQEAADAVSALARAIQRNPNSLLTGR